MASTDLPELSKKERKKLNQLAQKEQFEKEERRKKLMKWGVVFAGVVILIVGLWWLIKESSKPAPGEVTSDLGRDHVTDISSKKYSTNPPTSGPHFPIWAQRGAYPYVISDGYLIHSLEHGYIVISYNCDKKASVSESVEYKKGDPLSQQRLLGKGAMNPFSPSNPPAKIENLPKGFSSKECSQLVQKLSSFLDKYHRIVIVPRTNLDTQIALTAWDHIEKLNSFDESKINDFISSYENKGPEQTVE